MDRRKVVHDPECSHSSGCSRRLDLFASSHNQKRHIVHDEIRRHRDCVMGLVGSVGSINNNDDGLYVRIGNPVVRTMSEYDLILSDRPTSMSEDEYLRFERLLDEADRTPLPSSSSTVLFHPQAYSQTLPLVNPQLRRSD